MSHETLMSLNQFQIKILESLNILDKKDRVKYVITYGASLRNEWKAMRKAEAMVTPKHMLLKKFDSDELKEMGFNVEVIKQECIRYNERRNG
jgi:hypothetical protein